MKITATFAALLALHFTAHGEEQPKRTEAAGEVFNRADKNGDGKVMPEELPNAETFAKFDRNKDGVITLEETQEVLGAMKQKPDGAKGALAKGGAADGPLRRKLGDLAQRLIDRRTWPSTPQAAGGASAAPVTQGAKRIKPGDVGVGRQVEDATFTTLDGKARKLSDWKAQPGLAIAFASTTCPVSKRYTPSLARLEKELASRNIALLLVNPFASEKAEEIAAEIKAQGITAPYLHDASKALAQALNARTTTEVFLLDAQRTLIYRGALDDQYGVSYNLDAPRERYLLDAVTAMLAGKLPTLAATEAPGCELDIPAPAATATGTQVTYHRDVARILQQHCVQCHHDKGIAPFALDDIAEVTDRAKTIKRVIEDRAMPPWFAAPIAEGQPNPWANDHSLSSRDKADLLAWIGSKDRPLGNPADAPAPLKFSSEWNIGKPDLVVQIKKPFAIKAEGFMPYQIATVETTLAEDKWVQAYEIMPTAREVVHHVIVNVHAKGARIRGGGEGEGGYWAAYVPGNSSRIYPEGFARKLPAGATISFQIHYTPTGKATEDQLRMGLVFAKEPPRFAMHTAGVVNHKISIPPGEANHTETAQKPVPGDMIVTAFMAHMHVRGKAFRYELITADGKSETLLDIPRYDFNWQLRYELKEPRRLPRGSHVKVTAVYDNSPGNKANPDPTKTVRWGQQTYDEMMIGYIEYFTPMPAVQKVAAAGK